EKDAERIKQGDRIALARFITAYERGEITAKEMSTYFPTKTDSLIPVLGITGTGGAGKSSLTDELIRRFLHEIDDKKIAIISVDPTKRKTGGALLGDRIRMNAIFSERIYMRSLATRDAQSELSKATAEVVRMLRATDFDLIIIETSGIGQGDAAIE